MCKAYTGYHVTSEIEHGLCACTVDNPLAKARGLSLRTGAQTMLYLSLVCFFFCQFVQRRTTLEDEALPKGSSPKGKNLFLGKQILFFFFFFFFF